MQDNEELGLWLHMESIEAREAGYQSMQARRLRGTEYGHVFDNGVAMLDLVGPIFPRANMMTMSGATSIQQFTSDFVRAYQDPDIKGIVMNIDSPGGDVRGISESSAIINKLAKSGRKPVKAYAFGYMASAAYYIGSAAQSITANKSSVVGSIGVVMQGKMKGKDEIEITSSQSPNKRLDPTTDEGVAKIRQRLDDLADGMISDIASYRGITPEKVLSNYGQGDVFVGPRAKKQGLADKIGTLSQVVDEVSREADAPKGRSFTANKKADALLGSLEQTELVDAIEAIEEEEGIMGLRDLVNKLKASNDTTLVDAEAQTDANEGSESNEDVASVGQEDTEGTVGTSEDTPPVADLPSRETLEEQFADNAELFAVQLTTASRILPAQQAHAASMLINARIDDAIHGGSVTFVGEDGTLTEGTREEAVRAMFNAMPKHSMTQRAIKAVKEGSVEAKVLAETDPETVKQEGPISEERRQELLKSSKLGQKVLAAQK